MPHTDPYEAMDRRALHSALLALRVCPQCRADLAPVAYCPDVWGCGRCNETWHIPSAV